MIGRFRGTTHRMDESYKVLIVDDEEIVRRSLERLLVTFGHTVSHAASVAEALAMLEGHDVAVVDMLLPDGLGTEIVAAIRARGWPIRVALMTGRTSLELAERADAVFFKPFDMTAMVKWIGERPGGGGEPA